MDRERLRAASGRCEPASTARTRVRRSGGPDGDGGFSWRLKTRRVWLRRVDGQLLRLLVGPLPEVRPPSIFSAAVRPWTGPGGLSQLHNLPVFSVRNPHQLWHSVTLDTAALAPRPPLGQRCRRPYRIPTSRTRHADATTVAGGSVYVKGSSFPPMDLSVGPPADPHNNTCSMRKQRFQQPPLPRRRR